MLRLVLVAAAIAPLASACVRALPVDPELLGGLAQTSVVLAADGTVITSLHAEEDRRPVALADMPGVLVQAVLAAEDRRFYQHKGVDVRGVARAAVHDARTGEARQGGSTITQQLVKNTLVTPEKTISRKVREASLAMGLEWTLTKDQILERYLNTVYFGQGAYGVGAAARVYFGHPAQELTLPEAALLAGLIRSPASADPLRAPEAAKLRRAQVLRGMVETGAITDAQAAEANAAGLPRRAHRDTQRFAAAHAVADAVATLLDDKRLGATPDERRNAVFRGGLTIKLTIDLAQQEAAEAAVAAVLTHRDDPYAGVAAVKPGDGAITAMVGGRDFFSPRDPQAKVNLARGGSTKRQAGSTFKVFALLAALEAGVKPDETFEAGARAVIPCRCPKPWVVDNYEGSAYGRISLRRATEDSVNTAYARIVQRIGKGDVDAGVAAVLDLAEALGVRGAGGSPLRRKAGPAVVLGAQEVDPVSLAAAYAALAAGGVYSRPYLVASVTDGTGKVLLRNGPARKQVIPAGVAALANDVLQGVVRRGTGVRADLGRPVAGKTGTSQKYSDAWFVGYTPAFAAAVWVGVPSKQVPMIPENGFRTVIAGGTFPTMIWARFATTALLDLPDTDFPAPEGASITVEVDKARGCRPNRYTPASWLVERTYLRGQEPTEVCTVPTGPPATVVPAMLGLASDYAAGKLAEAGFLVTEKAVYDDNYPKGAVVGQVPPAGTAVQPGATVQLQISDGPDPLSRVPTLLGFTEERALRTLAAAGLVAEVVIEPSCTGGASCQARLAQDAGRVWRQDLAAGRRVAPGTKVRIAVGPRQG